MSVRPPVFVAPRAGRNASRQRPRASLPSGVAPEPLEPRRLFSVAAVEVSSTAWAPSFRDSLKTSQSAVVSYGATAADYQVAATAQNNLPWIRLNEITVKFDGPSDVQAQDLLVAGARVGRYPVARMAYDPATHTATWTLGRSVSNDKLLLRLRTTGGVFQSRVNILAGDVNQSAGPVNAADVRAVQARVSAQASGTDANIALPSAAFCDVDGSGIVDAQDVTTVRARLLSHLPAREPTVVLPTLPSSDGWYGTVMSATQYVASDIHLPKLSPKLSMVTDLVGSDSRSWIQSLARLRAAHPNLLIGTYHSARDAQYAGTSGTYPNRAIAREGLRPDQILMQHPTNPNAVIVDYSKTDARQYLVDQIVRNVVRTGRPLAYIDGVSHPETGFVLPWATTMELVRAVTTNLHTLGKRVMINAAWIPGFTTNQSVEEFIDTGADGVSLESGFHPVIRNNVARIQMAIAQYRRMLDAGLTIAFAPPANGPSPDPTTNREAEQRLQAAFGMMFRKPGDRLFVTQNFWRRTPDWTEWPEKFGAAFGDAVIITNAQGQVEMTRRFTNYTLKLNTATKEVTTVAVVRPAFAPEATVPI